MKEHIDLSQLNELSEKGKERLREWWEKHLEYGTFFAWKNNKRQKNWYVELWYEGSEFEMPNKWNNFYPLLSIGQLIEFLENKNELSIVTEPGEDLERNPVVIKKILFAYKSCDISKIELCDALWEAVKDILEKEDK